MNILNELQSNYRRQVSKLMLLSGLILSVSCSGCGPAPPGRRELGARATPTPVSTERSATTDDLVVYLDVSEPMKGYVFADGQSVFSKTLRTLREFAAAQTAPVKVYVRTVAKEVGPVQANAALANASYSQKIYTGIQSNLVGAIAAFNQSLHTMPAPSPVASGTLPATPTALGTLTVAAAKPTSTEAITSPITPPRFHVLVTDGVQYAAQAHTNDACASGADAFCVQQKIRALLNQGWAGVVLALRSEYCCAFFSENIQKWIKYDTKGLSPAEHRPFYLFIFSPEHEALDDFVISLKASLRRSINPNPPLRELPLTARYTTGVIGFERNTDFKLKDNNNKARLRCTKLNGKADEPLVVSLQIQEESRAVAIPFEITLTLNLSEHGKDADDPEEFSKLLDWSLEKVYPVKEQNGKRYPEIVLGKVTTNKQGRLVVEATAQWPHAAGTAAWQGYRMVGRFKRDAEPSWINHWSTPRDVEPASGSCTLDLRTTLLALWRTPFMEKQPVAEAYLRIGPQ